MRTLKKIGYVVYFNILFLSFVYVDLINETEWLKDTLYGITWIALLFSVIYYKKHNFDKIILLIVELIILNRKHIVEYVFNNNFSQMDGAELTAWIIAAVLFVIIIAIVLKCAYGKLKAIETKLSDEADDSGTKPVSNVNDEEQGIDKGVWIVAIFMFLLSCYFLYLYQFVYMKAGLNLYIHEEAISGVLNFLSEYAIFIVGVLIVIWLIVNAIDAFLLNRKANKDGTMKCKTMLHSIVNFMAFVTVDLFSAVVDLLVGDTDVITEDEDDEDNDIGSDTEEKTEQETETEAVSENDVVEEEAEETKNTNG